MFVMRTHPSSSQAFSFSNPTTFESSYVIHTAKTNISHIERIFVTMSKIWFSISAYLLYPLFIKPYHETGTTISMIFHTLAFLAALTGVLVTRNSPEWCLRGNNLEHLTTFLM